MRILPEEALALIVDLQEKLVPTMTDAPQLVKNTKAVLEGLKIAEIPILVTEQYPRGLGQTVSELVSVIPDVKRQEKLEFSCYGNEQIRKIIDASGRKTILLCGIEAHVCVLQTLIDLCAAGYHVVLIEDCIQSRHAHDQKIAVKRAIYEGACITTFESVLFELVQKAGTTQFKQLSALVKSL